MSCTRDYIREKTLEGQAAAAAKGNHGGRPRVIDDDMLVFARALRTQGTLMPESAAKLIIRTGKNPGAHPSVASLYRGPGCRGGAAAASVSQPATAPSDIGASYIRPIFGEYYGDPLKAAVYVWLVVPGVHSSSRRGVSGSWRRRPGRR